MALQEGLHPSREMFPRLLLVVFKIKTHSRGSLKTPDTRHVLQVPQPLPRDTQDGAAETQRQGRGPPGSGTGKGGWQFPEEHAWKRKASFNWSQIQGDPRQRNKHQLGCCWSDIFLLLSDLLKQQPVFRRTRPPGAGCPAEMGQKPSGPWRLPPFTHAHLLSPQLGRKGGEDGAAGAGRQH